ncbi:MAG: alpha-mannosidase [Candidatus Binatia bacterium]|nr:MAG: alpha-mannosidase [Candidatus Binatia bacterium]
MPSEGSALECFVVSHTHWDREWYRTFQSFRARLVDTVDRVLDLVREDPSFRFLLDGQTVVLEDYLEVRPDREGELARACREGNLAIGPWYVQPDSLLPGGETHVRNLLEGRRAGERFGEVSGVAYVPDSFGHPAQFPQLFAGFGLGPFVFWRGAGDEASDLSSEFSWEAPDGSRVACHRMDSGYFSVAGLPDDPEEAARALREAAEALAKKTKIGRVLLMHGIDHAYPEPLSPRALEAAEAATGWTFRRASLEEFARGWPRDLPVFRGELLGARVANLLPGVWSARMPFKLRNRRVETVLLRWAEPWAALGERLGLASERAALREAWRFFLQNQAHDSICGCSIDRVHEQTSFRYDAAEELGLETARRILDRVAGVGPERRTPWTDEIEVAVFNPSPRRRTDVVRFPLEPEPAFEVRAGKGMQLHPLLLSGLLAPGFSVEGTEARVVPDVENRMHLGDEHPPRSVEFVARDVPAFGYRKFRLRPSQVPTPDAVDQGRTISNGEITVAADPEGTLSVSAGGRSFPGLAAVEDVGDRGDTYDFDPVEGGRVEPAEVRVERRRHPSGIEELHVTRVFHLPAGLAPDRSRRARETVEVLLRTSARLVSGLRRVDLEFVLENRARDHRLRLLFPTAEPRGICLAATTFGTVERRSQREAPSGWVHPPPRTFPHQGFVAAGGLVVGCPGLPEAELLPGGTLAITLLRSVGWLARFDLRSRPVPAGPQLATPGAQCLGTIRARCFLFFDLDFQEIADAEAGFLAVPAGPAPVWPPDRSLVEVLSTDRVVLSCLKPAETRPGTVLRFLNPAERAARVELRVGFPFAEVLPVRLDETPISFPLRHEGERVSFELPPYALRSLLFR